MKYLIKALTYDNSAFIGWIAYLLFNILLFIISIFYSWVLIPFIIFSLYFLKESVPFFKQRYKDYIQLKSQKFIDFEFENWKILRDNLKNYNISDLKKKYSLSDEHLDLKYWFKFVDDQARIDAEFSDSYGFRNSDDYNLLLSDNIFAHAQEYINKHTESNIDEIKKFPLMRILSFGIIHEELNEYEKRMLNNPFNIGDKIFEYGPQFRDFEGISSNSKIKKKSAVKLLLIHSKARLYGAIKFALISGLDKNLIFEWYPNFEYNKALINGTNGLERTLLKTIDDKNSDTKDFDYVEKMKLIFDGKERVEIYELSKSEKKSIPYWFKGPFYKQGGEVYSINTKNKVQLNSLEKSIFTEIQLSTLLIEKLSKSISREQFSTIPFLKNIVLIVDAGTQWFEANNKNAFKKLF